MTMKRSLRVLITKSEEAAYWYADLIGQEFDVVEWDWKDFAVKADCDLSQLYNPIRFIRKTDCIEVEAK
jgi:hypothetical protein